MILAMKKINQRRKELKMSQYEWFMIWMLGHVVKRNRIDNFKYQSLRKVIKKRGVDVIENFDKKFKEMKVEGNRKSVAGMLYT